MSFASDDLKHRVTTRSRETEKPRSYGGAAERAEEERREM
jgi:hypothetical protein